MALTCTDDDPAPLFAVGLLLFVQNNTIRLEWYQCHLEPLQQPVVQYEHVRLVAVRAGKVLLPEYCLQLWIGPGLPKIRLLISGPAIESNIIPMYRNILYG